MHQDVYGKGLQDREWNPKRKKNEAFSFLSLLKSSDFHICFKIVFMFLPHLASIHVKVKG